jgi:hypothetical protein
VDDVALAERNTEDRERSPARSRRGVGFVAGRGEPRGFRASIEAARRVRRRAAGAAALELEVVQDIGEIARHGSSRDQLSSAGPESD